MSDDFDELAEVLDGVASLPPDCWRDDFCLLGSDEAVLAGMRIEPSNRDAWTMDAEILREGGRSRLDGLHDQRLRQGAGDSR